MSSCTILRKKRRPASLAFITLQTCDPCNHKFQRALQKIKDEKFIKTPLKLVKRIFGKKVGATDAESKGIGKENVAQLIVRLSTERFLLYFYFTLQKLS